MTLVGLANKIALSEIGESIILARVSNQCFNRPLEIDFSPSGDSYRTSDRKSG
ncbi:hypothetical protein ACE1B6_07390 [Aerosakkonemataceae cyanobacterium BLCC-F154]|uniref:Uncharacterized protein n=1 Tax=Floridaenema fluviatile BLCC-F154 TaxID=3153640 RepID=A0ABV4Y8H0_9CYAN